MIEAGDRDAHGGSLHAGRGRVEPCRHAAAGVGAGAPKSFQPDCQRPPFDDSDCMRWDATIPHGAEVVGDEEGHGRIVTLLASC